MELDQYTPVLPYFAHQREALRRGGNKRSFAFLMDPGLGKTKVTLDNAFWLYRRGVINGLLIHAPNDVDAQWVEEQVPRHRPPDIHGDIDATRL